MRKPRIYLPTTLECGHMIKLDQKTANHVTRVLRLKPGASIILFNGQGGEYEATLENTTPDNVCARIIDHSSKNTESPLNIILAQANKSPSESVLLAWGVKGKELMKLKFNTLNFLFLIPLIVSFIPLILGNLMYILVLNYVNGFDERSFFLLD